MEERRERDGKWEDGGGEGGERGSKMECVWGGGGVPSGVLDTGMTSPFDYF